jgi:hypothetical protein
MRSRQFVFDVPSQPRHVVCQRRLQENGAPAILESLRSAIGRTRQTNFGSRRQNCQSESPDGKHLAFTEMTSISNAWMIEGF